MDSMPKLTPTSGPTPKELILQALAGCNMMNIAAIVTKARKKLERFWVEIDSEVSDKIPNAFESINIVYNFIGEDLNEDLIEKAINLSHYKYCTVGAMLKDSIKISYSYKIIKEGGVKNIFCEELKKIPA